MEGFEEEIYAKGQVTKVVEGSEGSICDVLLVTTQGQEKSDSDSGRLGGSLCRESGSERRKRDDGIADGTSRVGPIHQLPSKQWNRGRRRRREETTMLL